MNSTTYFGIGIIISPNVLFIKDLVPKKWYKPATFSDLEGTVVTKNGEYEIITTLNRTYLLYKCMTKKEKVLEINVEELIEFKDFLKKCLNYKGTLKMLTLHC